MRGKLEYHAGVERLNRATVVVLACAFVASAGLLGAQAQINGVSPSVTSMNFGGHFTTAPGVPASVTSLGPRGFTPAFPNCCINPLFPINPNPPFDLQRHHHGRFFPGAAVYAVPVPYLVPVETEADDSADEQYNGGPTIFDRRGPGTPARHDDYGRRDDRSTEPVATADAAATPVADQPQTVLVFKDGHEIEVKNYAVVGSTLFDLTPGHRRRIALSELDLEATAKQNDDRGIDFQLPPAAEAN